MRTRGWTRPESLQLGLQLIACAVVSFAVLGIFLRHGVAPAVIGYNLSPAERVLQGEAPYRDFLYNYTPGVLWLNAALFKVFGTNLATSRAGVLIARVLAILLLFLISRRFLSGWRLVLPVMMALAWVGYGDVLKVFPTQYGMVFVLASCLLVLKRREYLVNCPSSFVTRNWLLVLAGASAGLVFLFKHNVGSYVLIAGLLSVFEPLELLFDRTERSPIRSRVKKVLPILLGFGAIVVLMSLILAAQSAFVPMFKHFLNHATAYGEAKGIALPHPRVLGFSTVALVLIVIAGAFWSRRAPRTFPIYVLAAACLLAAAVLVSGLGLAGGLGRSLIAQAYYLPIWAAGAAFVRVAAAMQRKPRAVAAKISNAIPEAIDNSRRAGVMTLSWFSTAAFLEVFPRSDLDHLVRALPLSLLLVLALITASSGAGPKPLTQLSHHRVFIASAVSILIIVIGVRVTWSTQFVSGLRWKENAPLTFQRGSWVAGEPAEAARLNAVVDYVANNSIPGDAIFALSRKMTSVYFLSGRENTTRLPWFDSAGVTKQDRERIYQMIANREFRLILIGGDLTDEISEAQQVDADEADRPHDRVIGFISRGYVISAMNNGVTIMAPRID